MTEIADRYRRLSDAFATTVAGVDDDQWENPTPCENWTARELVGHVVDSQSIFLRLVGREVGDVPSVDADPGAAWDAVRAVVRADLDDPERAGTEFTGFFGASTFESAVDRYVNSDLVVHRWDLARATGQDETMDSADAERVLEGAHAFGDAFRGPGVCGPEVAVPADADIQTRVLGFYGRGA